MSFHVGRTQETKRIGLNLVQIKYCEELIFPALTFDSFFLLPIPFHFLSDKTEKHESQERKKKEENISKS